MRESFNIWKVSAFRYVTYIVSISKNKAWKNSGLKAPCDLYNTGGALHNNLSCTCYMLHFVVHHCCEVVFMFFTLSLHDLLILFTVILSEYLSFGKVVPRPQDFVLRRGTFLVLLINRSWQGRSTSCWIFLQGMFND